MDFRLFVFETVQFRSQIKSFKRPHLRQSTPTFCGGY